MNDVIEAAIDEIKKMDNELIKKIRNRKTKK